MQKRLKEIKPGEVFKFGSYEWIKLEEDEYILTKKTIGEYEFNRYTNCFSYSLLQLHLVEKFLGSLLKNGARLKDFKSVYMVLSPDDGTNPYFTAVSTVGLLTAEMYRSNRHLLEPIDSSWWLATPVSTDSDTLHVKAVNERGLLVCEHIGRKVGVRPLCRLEPETLVEVPDEDKVSEETGKEDITDLIKKWAEERNLDKAEPKAQMVKLMEELGELANGINKGRKEQIIDSIGDTYVVLTILSLQLGLDIKDCIKAALEEIKNRKGKMINGTFVKEEDLEG